MSGARSQAVWVAAAAAGLEVVTAAGLVVAPSLLARLLFGSEMNASGGLVGRISGLVMLHLEPNGSCVLTSDVYAIVMRFIAAAPCDQGSAQSGHGASEWWRDPRAIAPLGRNSTTAP